MNRNSLAIGAVVLGIALLLVAGFFATYEHKEVTESTPAHGEARYNRYFAFEQVLGKLGLKVTSLTTLDPERMPLHPGDTLVLGDGLERIDVEQSARLAAWVRLGGHLVVSPGNPASGVRTPLFEALPVLDARKADYVCDALRPIVPVAGKPGENVPLCGLRFRLTTPAQAALDASIGDQQDGYLFARTHFGAGTLSLLADTNLIDSAHLRQLAAQQFGWRLLTPNLGRGRIYLLYALDGVPFLKLLLLQGWPALLALSLLLAAWMARQSERFGPLMPAPSLHRRALLEHVQAAGEFVYRRDAGRSLHQLAAQAVLARVRRRDPSCAMLNGDALHDRLALRSGLAAEQVRQAFQSPANAQAFRHSIITLARLRSRP
jgi:hypothetical protein